MKILLIHLILLFGPCSSHHIKEQNEMLNYSQCLQMAKDKLSEVSANDPNYVIWEEKTIEKEYGWVFTPSTKGYIKSKDRSSLVPGVMPIVVNKMDSTCFMVSSSQPLESALKAYEDLLKKKNED